MDGMSESADRCFLWIKELLARRAAMKPARRAASLSEPRPPRLPGMLIGTAHLRLHPAKISNAHCP